MRPPEGHYQHARGPWSWQRGGRGGRPGLPLGGRPGPPPDSERSRSHDRVELPDRRPPVGRLRQTDYYH